MAVETIGYKFDNCEVRLLTHEIYLSGARVEIQPKVFALVDYLISQRDVVVTKDALQEHVWQGAYITDAALTRAVMKARKAIGDDAQNQKHIKTLHGKGYRFVAEVEVLSPDALANSNVPTPLNEQTIADVSREESILFDIQSKRVVPLAGVEARQTVKFPSIGFVGRLSLVKRAGFIIAITALVALSYLFIQAPITLLPIRLAVFPIDNQLVDDEHDWIPLGLMSLINNQLSKEAKIPVVSSLRILATLESEADNQLRSMQNPSALNALNEVDGATHFIQYRLEPDEQGLKLSYVILDLSGKAIANRSFRGDSPTKLASLSIESVAKKLDFPFERQFTPRIVSDDAFLNEAYSRGLALQLKGNSAEALDYFKVASELDRSLFWPRYEYALSLRITGQEDAAEKLLLELESRQLDMEQKISICNALGLLYWRTSENDKARTYLEKGLALSIEAGDSEREATLLGNLAIQAKNRSEFERSRRFLGRSLAIYQKQGLKNPPGWLSNTMANLNSLEGNFGEALVHYKLAIEYFTKVKNNRFLASSLSGYADTLVQLGQYKDAEKIQNEAMRIRQELADERGIVSSLFGIFDRLLAVGKYQQADKALQQILVSSRYKKDDSVKSAFEKRRARFLLKNGQFDAAVLSIKQAEDIAQKFSNDLDLSNLKMEKAEMLIAQGELADAEQIIDGLMKKAAKQGYQRLLVTGNKLLAKIAIESKKVDAAIKFYQQSINLARSIKDNLSRARTEIDLANLYLDIGDLAETETLIGLLNSQFSHLYDVQILNVRYAESTKNLEQAKEYLLQAKSLANERWNQNLETKLENILLADNQ